MGLNFLCLKNTHWCFSFFSEMSSGKLFESKYLNCIFASIILGLCEVKTICTRMYNVYFVYTSIPYVRAK